MSNYGTLSGDYDAGYGRTGIVEIGRHAEHPGFDPVFGPPRGAHSTQDGPQGSDAGADTSGPARTARGLTAPPRYTVKCDDCKEEIRRTDSVAESAAGGRCDKCRPAPDELAALEVCPGCGQTRLGADQHQLGLDCAGCR